LIPETVVLVVHQIDHIIAEKHGGLTEADNLALCTCAEPIEYLVRPARFKNLAGLKH